MKFYVTNQEGKVLRFGECTPDVFTLQAGGNEILHEGEPVLEPLPDIYGTTYSGQRLREYPGIGEQLDMLWHSMNSGEIPKAATFFNSIAAVKTKYPKD